MKECNLIRVPERLNIVASLRRNGESLIPIKQQQQPRKEVLVIWRKLTGTPEGDNLMLIEEEFM